MYGGKLTYTNTLCTSIIQPIFFPSLTWKCLIIYILISFSPQSGKTVKILIFQHLVVKINLKVKVN